MSVMLFKQGIFQADSTKTLEGNRDRHKPIHRQHPYVIQSLVEEQPTASRKTEGDTLEKRRLLQANNIMTTPVITALPHDLISQVTKTLTEAQVSHIVVVNTNRNPLGVINISKLLKVDSPNTSFIQNLCHSDVLAVEEDTIVRDIAAIFIQYKATAVCVVNAQHQLTGIISRRDLMTLLVSGPAT